MSQNTIIFLSIAGFIVLYLIIIYNRLISLKNRFVNGFAQIDVQLQRRYDLIPNLVETAKKYMDHERDTLEKVIQARNSAHSAESKVNADPADPSAMKALVGAETALTSSMGQFFALAENYPDLKSNQTMAQLMEELTSTENKVGFARQAFNDAVMTYNTYREQFPNNILSGLFAFKAAAHFEIENAEAKQAVKVKF
ncbi:MAG: LemA family protein [Gammaproteobacteria bacterium]